MVIGAISYVTGSGESHSRAHVGCACLVHFARSPILKAICYALILCFLPVVTAAAETASSGDRSYVLGPQDTITVRVTDLPEFKDLGAVRVDQEGNLRLPVTGRLHVEGLTVEQVEKEIAAKLSAIMQHPEVSVALAELRSHPVSVLGAVRTPGVYQITGTKTLYEVLSLAGGLNQDASNHVKITRQVSAGVLPLPGARLNANGEFYVAELNVRDVMEAKVPDDNIAVLSGDVISVPKAELVYVVGAVRRAGGFPLAEKEQISVLQAVSLAEGLDKIASAKKARILRQSEPGTERKEIAINLDAIIKGRAKDVSLQANDILFIPTSVGKSASITALQAAMQVGGAVVVGSLY
jgi:polysaccharide export outer membrane protein